MDRPDLRRTQDESEPIDAGSASERNWVDELIAISRPGLDMKLPERGYIPRPVPFTFDDFS